MIPAGLYIAECPLHGERTFERSESHQWWYCPELPCTSVIPDELITPDGADVLSWVEYRRLRVERRREEQR